MGPSIVKTSTISQLDHNLSQETPLHTLLMSNFTVICPTLPLLLFLILCNNSYAIVVLSVIS